MPQLKKTNKPRDVVNPNKELSLSSLALSSIPPSRPGISRMKSLLNCNSSIITNEYESKVGPYVVITGSVSENYTHLQGLLCISKHCLSPNQFPVLRPFLFSYLYTSAQTNDKHHKRASHPPSTPNPTPLRK